MNLSKNFISKRRVNWVRVRKIDFVKVECGELSSLMRLVKVKLLKSNQTLNLPGASGHQVVLDRYELGEALEVCFITCVPFNIFFIIIDKAFMLSDNSDIDYSLLLSRI
jgi:hypothetical protein